MASWISSFRSGSSFSRLFSSMNSRHYFAIVSRLMPVRQDISRVDTPPRFRAIILAFFINDTIPFHSLSLKIFVALATDKF